MAAEEASFKMVMLSISLGLRKVSGFLGTEFPPSIDAPRPALLSMGIPSITYKGSLLPRMEEVPRIFMVRAERGSWLLGVMVTPAVLPCNNCSGEEITPLLKFSPITAATEP